MEGIMGKKRDQDEQTTQALIVESSEELKGYAHKLHTSHVKLIDKIVDAEWERPNVLSEDQKDRIITASSEVRFGNKIFPRGTIFYIQKPQKNKEGINIPLKVGMPFRYKNMYYLPVNVDFTTLTVLCLDAERNAHLFTMEDISNNMRYSIAGYVISAVDEELLKSWDETTKEKTALLRLAEEE